MRIDVIENTVIMEINEEDQWINKEVNTLINQYKQLLCCVKEYEKYNFILNFNGIRILTTIAFSNIIMLRKLLSNSNRKFAVINDSKHIKKTMENVQLNEFVKIYNNVFHALENMNNNNVKGC